MFRPVHQGAGLNIQLLQQAEVSESNFLPVHRPDNPLPGDGAEILGFRKLQLTLLGSA